MDYSFWLAARVILYASSHRQDNTYHSLCLYQSCHHMGYSFWLAARVLFICIIPHSTYHSLCYTSHATIWLQWAIWLHIQLVVVVVVDVSAEYLNHCWVFTISSSVFNLSCFYCTSTYSSSTLSWAHNSAIWVVCLGRGYTGSVMCISYYLG